MRTRYLPFHLPDIAESEIDAVVDTLRSGWLTTGPKVRQFEDEFARFLGVDHAVAVNSGTAALHLALEAGGVAQGDEVIVPTMTFAATAEVVLYLKARPVLVDCHPDTLNLDLSCVERLVTPRTKAIMPVHFAGQPCEMDQLLEMAASFGLKVIEDAAHALPAWYRHAPVGTLGDMTCFSFYATKTITTGEGGMVTTNTPEYADRVRIMSLHGISKDAWKRYRSDGTHSYEILYPGYKYNLTDLAAALGIEQLKKCEQFWRARARIAGMYDAAFADVPEIGRPVTNPHVEHAWHLYVIQLAVDEIGITRDEFIDQLKERHIGTSVHFTPLHLHPLYRDMFGYRPQDFPVATSVSRRIVSLPIYPAMTDEDVNDVVEAVRAVIAAARQRSRVAVNWS